MSYNTLRRGRCSLPHADYLVTFVTRHRTRVFLDDDAAEIFRAELRSSEKRAEALWHAWVLMPDHFHGLLTLGPGTSLQTLVGQLKGRSSRRINAHRGRSGPIWQPAFHDHAMRREEDRSAIAAYIIDNPVRAGLVLQRTDYPHWGCRWLSPAPEYSDAVTPSG